ncbi:MAG: SCO family protein [Gemmatimonadales bacterium]
MRRAILVLALLSAGCRDPIPEIAADISGHPLPKPVPRPSFVLTDMHGGSYDFADRTRGRLTLLFFGYTHCPDVCPATMANLGAVISRMPATERARLDVVFVTTDPERDTAERLQGWLGRFENEVVGLTGTIAEVEAAQRAARVGVAIRDTASGNYAVAHAAQVLVFSPDDSSHVAYPFGTRQASWAADIPKLLKRWTGS